MDRTAPTGSMENLYGPAGKMVLPKRALSFSVKFPPITFCAKSGLAFAQIASAPHARVLAKTFR